MTKNSILQYFLFFFVISLTSFTVSAKENIVLIGTVCNLKNKPIKDVKVLAFKIINLSSSSKKVLVSSIQTTTDNEGKFSLELSNNENFEIYFSKEKMKSVQGSIQILSSKMKGGQKISIRHTMDKNEEFAKIKINSSNYSDIENNYQIESKSEDVSFILKHKGSEFIIPIHNYDTYSLSVTNPNYLHSYDTVVEINDRKTYELDLNFKEEKVHKFDIYPFEVNTDIISSSAIEELNSVISTLKKRPQLSVEISCHTDSRGDDDFNLSLSKKQAKSILLYFISQGISRKRVVTDGFGENLLINECKNNVKCSNLKHLENRRVEYRFKKMD
ncbi:OmpA family protein [Flammeovirga yaeyamensis]|nr:OmpA family protein [Flammeovirga yaeyamensis]